VHQSGSAGDSDAGWSEVALPTPQRIDLLTLTNGTLLPLGQTELPAGTYTQMRLVLGSTTPPGWPTGTLANSIKPTGGTEVPLTTPSGQQSGLKMNIHIDVPEDKVADFAIDFDACKSFVRAGKSGKILLKPVLTVLPILSDVGQRVIGWVDPSMLVLPGTNVSVQQGGEVKRATPPHPTTGLFVLNLVPNGTYDLVVTAAGRVNAVITGVPVTETAPTYVGSDTVRINTPASTNSYVASGTVTVNGSSVATGAVVRALQSFSTGPTFEAASARADDLTGEYGFTLPADEPMKTVYAANPASFTFAAGPLPSQAGKYTIEAKLPGSPPPTQSLAITLAPNTVTDFTFP
jgi:Domain of unknown function (DUF4382)